MRCPKISAETLTELPMIFVDEMVTCRLDGFTAMLIQSWLNNYSQRMLFDGSTSLLPICESQPTIRTQNWAIPP